ncbi:MAG: DUF3786 domain-containing protein [Pseudomonadota bacterium]
MAQLKNHLDVYKLLPKTNCRACGLAACLAFAVGVMQGQKRLADCPHLAPEVVAQFDKAGGGQARPADDVQQRVLALQDQVRQCDLAAAAQRLGLAMRGNQMVIPCLGKDFNLGPDGIVSSCHVNSWLSLPILDYALHGAGVEPRGQWTPLRELPGGLDWGNFFEHRCEKPLKKVIDEHTSLFELIIDIFSGQPAPAQFDSDIAVLIHPLPRLPMLLCYWKAEDGMDSAFNMFFDSTAHENLGVGSIYILGVGLVTMFEKIARTHGQ